MSSSPDIVIIGGGVIGLSIARTLVREGRRVTVLERGVCGAEASWAGAGIVTPLNPHRADIMARLVSRSVEMYPGWCAALHEESGVDPEYQRCGELQLAFDEHEASILRADDQIARERPILDPDRAIAYEFHDRRALGTIELNVGPDPVGGLECRLGGQVRNPRLLRALRIACERAGVDIREGTPVTDFILDGARVGGVITDRERIPAGRVVLCAGAWSSSIGDRLRELMPVRPVRGQMILLKFDASSPSRETNRSQGATGGLPASAEMVPQTRLAADSNLAARPFSRVISYGSTYLVPRRDGHVLLGATYEPEAGFVKRTTPSGISGLIQQGLRIAPIISEASAEATWAGLRPGTPDERPYIGAVPGFDGLIAATGHLRNGLTLAPATAEAITSLLSDQKFDIDLSPFAPGRA